MPTVPPGSRVILSPYGHCRIAKLDLNIARVLSAYARNKFPDLATAGAQGSVIVRCLQRVASVGDHLIVVRVRRLTA